MIPQEKAKKLYEKMLFCYQGHIDEYTAKQCALIAADEIWNALENERVFVEYQYWQKVIKEIENL